MANSRLRYFGSRTLTAIGTIAALAITSLGAGATAQDKPTLTIVGAEHLHNNLTGKVVNGVNLLTKFEEEFGAQVKFVLSPAPELRDVVNRLGTLPQTEEDLIYTLDMEQNERYASFLSPLDDFMAEKPIAGFPEAWPSGFIEANTINDKLYVFPVRCGTFGLWFNKEIMAERGVSGAPTTPEELLEAARKMTFTRDNGQKVYGFAPRGTKYDTDNFAIIARMFGGELIGPDLSIQVNSAETVKAIKFLQSMYQEGLIPPNWPSMDGNAVDQFFKDGLAAMIPAGTGYRPRYSDGKSAVSGKAELGYLPLVAELQTADRTFSDSITFVWNIGILQGSTDKELAYDFVRYLARPDVQLDMATNENGVCSFTTLEELGKSNADWNTASAIMKQSRQPIPGFNNTNQARDLIGGAIQEIVVNNLDAQAALDDLARRLERLTR